MFRDGHDADLLEPVFLVLEVKVTEKQRHQVDMAQMSLNENQVYLRDFILR